LISAFETGFPRAGWRVWESSEGYLTPPLGSSELSTANTETPPKAAQTEKSTQAIWATNTQVLDFPEHKLGIRLATPFFNRHGAKMFQMARRGGFKSVLIRAILVSLLWEVGCSRQIGVPAEEGTEQTSQTPFQDEARSGNSADSSSLAAGQYVDSTSQLPFHQIQSLPAGTLIMVRLKAPILAEKPAAKDLFQAVLDAPLVVEGATLIPRGADVTGRVESARTSQMRPGRGYIQLALQSVRIGGIDVPVQTASLFVRQAQQKDHSAPAIHLEKGRRLTFRLIQPVYASNQTSQIAR
jgi:hypothetical protein